MDGGLVLCDGCDGLRGEVTTHRGERVWQHCCGQARREDGEQVAALCSCCAAAVIPTGSRYSSPYCRSCSQALDGEAPVSHRLFPVGPDESESFGVRVAAEIREMIVRDRRAARWRRQRIDRIRREGGFGGAEDVPLREYLTAARRVPVGFAEFTELVWREEG